MICQRCGKETNRFRMSMFNTDECCPECIAKEQEHPLYKTARETERNEVLNGNYNFAGVGKPSDL